MFMNPLGRIVVELAKGNPGCAAMLVDVAHQCPPEDLFALVHCLVRYDLTGSRAYMLWNDACGRNSADLVGLARKIDSGRLSIETVEAHLAEGRCRPFTPDEETESTAPVKNDRAVAFEKTKEAD